MRAKKSEIWLADLNPKFGREAGKTRPVLVVQTDFLNKVHPSTLICPITTNIQPQSSLLRVNISKGTAGIDQDSDVMIDQLRAIDNRRLIKKIGEVSRESIQKVKENLKIILDLEE
jgi:mRNA interferase MazF